MMGMRLHLKYNNLLIWFKYTPLIRNQITHEFIRKSSIIFIRRKKGIWGKLPEAPNATIFGNTKTPHKPSTHVKFHNVTLGGLINNSYHQFGFGDTPYGPSRDDWIYGDHDPDNDVENSMILTNLSKRDKVSTSDISKILSIPNPSSTQGMEELNIDGKLHCQVKTSFIYMSTNCNMRWTMEHINIIITSVKKVDNVIPTQVWVKPPYRSIRGWSN